MNILITSIIILVLIIINGIFASSEMALVSLTASMLESDNKYKNSKKTKLILKFINKPTNFLSTIQIGITLIGFVNGVIASDQYALSLIDLFNITTNLNVIKPIFMALVTIILVFLQVLFGELIPKRIAFAYPKKIAYAYIYLLYVIQIIFRPFVLLLTVIANGVARLFGVKKDNNDESVSEEEIISILNNNTKTDITNDEVKLIENIFSFNDLEVQAIMIHRTKMVCIDVKYDYNKIIKLINKEQFSRYPVYENNTDNIIGILNIKDIINLITNNETTFDLRKLISKPLYFPESSKIKTIFETMKKEHTHMAIIIDEYGGTSGLVTLEDIIEEILGNINDEFDSDEVKKIDTNTYLVDGSMNISDLEKLLDIEITNDDYYTVSGYILSNFEDLPIIDREFNMGELKFIVKKYDNQVIKKVLIKK